MIQFNQVFPAVDLPSEPKQKFRVQCSSDSGSFKLNLEARNSKQQWETVIVNDEDTINGIPKAIVVHALKCALEAQNCKIEKSDEAVPPSKTDSKIDILIVREKCNISLDFVVFGGIWMNVTFKLQPIEVLPLDLLRAQLMDAEEEITSLKEAISELKSVEKKSDSAVIALRATAAPATGGMVAWPTVTANTSKGVFVVSPDNTTITVQQAGLYQVYFRLGIRNTTNGQAAYLRKNGANVAQAYYSDANGYHNTVQLTEVLSLTQNDKLSVVPNFANALDVGLNSCFTVVKMA